MGLAIRQLESLRPGFESGGSGGDMVAMRTADDHGPRSPVKSDPSSLSSARGSTDATPLRQAPATERRAPVPANVRNKAEKLEGVTNKRAKYVIMHADDEDYEDATLDFAGLGGREVDLEGYATLGGSRNDEFKDLPSFAGEEAGGRGSEPELSLVERLQEKMAGGLEEFNEMGAGDKVLYLMEWPFTVARRFSVPITADENYVKPYLIMSVAFMPLWFVGYYMGMATSVIGGSTVSGSDDATRDDFDDPANIDDDVTVDDGDDGRRVLFAARDFDLQPGFVSWVSAVPSARRLGSGSNVEGGFPVLLLAMIISCSAAAALYCKCGDKRPPPTIVAVSPEVRSLRCVSFHYL
jgi:hypothetical protein